MQKNDLLHIKATTESTSTDAKLLALDGAPGGTVVIADCQTGGRGRFGRSFYSPPGVGLYLSMILRPELGLSELIPLTALAALSVCDAIERTCGFIPSIKWVNDIVYQGRKLCGILTELSTATEHGGGQCAVVGVGVNVNQLPEDFPEELRDRAISLREVCGREIERKALAANLIAALSGLSEILSVRDKSWLELYRSRCVTIDQQVKIEQNGNVRHGRALGVDENAALIVRFEDGATETVSSGEASVRGMSGYI